MFATKVFARRLAALLVGASWLLAGCSNPAQPPSAPSGFSVTPGDGQVVVNFSQELGLTYWIFLAQSAAITRSNYNSFPSARIVTPAADPQVISQLTNGVEYAFLINSTSGGAAGPSTSSLSATPRPAGNNFQAGLPTNAQSNNSIAFGLTRISSLPIFVMVGSGGAIFTSQVQPGQTFLDANGNQPWQIAGSPLSANLNGVAYNASLERFVVVGDNGSIAYSDDGKTWTAAAQSSTASNLTAVTAFGRAFVAVGSGGIILNSQDGSTWTVQLSNSTSDLLGVNFSGGSLIALGRTGAVLTSADSVNWATVPVPTTADLYAFTQAKPNLATVGSFYIFGAGGTILTSLAPNASWTSLSQPATSNDLHAVTVGSRIVAVGASGTIIYSDDGIAWQLANSPSNANLKAVLFETGVYTAVGDGGASLTSF